MRPPRSSWASAASSPLRFAGIVVTVALIGLGLLAWRELKTNHESGSISIEPGQVIHTVMVETNVSASPPSVREEYWRLVGDGDNTARAHVVAYDAAGKVTLEGWTDSSTLTTTNVTDGQLHSISRPPFQSVFMWTDEAHITDEIMHASLLPGATPAPDAPVIREIGKQTIAGVTVRVYEQDLQVASNPSLPFNGPGTRISRVFISDDPFGLDFGEERFYQDNAGKTYPLFSRTMTSFEVLDADQVPVGGLSTPPLSPSPSP
jgi:YD repeat-containing protein